MKNRYLPILTLVVAILTAGNSYGQQKEPAADESPEKANLEGKVYKIELDAEEVSSKGVDKPEGGQQQERRKKEESSPSPVTTSPASEEKSAPEPKSESAEPKKKPVPKDLKFI